MKCNVCGGVLEDGDVDCQPCEQPVHRFGCSREVIIRRDLPDKPDDVGVVVVTMCNWCYGDMDL